MAGLLRGLGGFCGKTAQGAGRVLWQDCSGGWEGFAAGLLRGLGGFCGRTAQGAGRVLRQDCSGGWEGFAAGLLRGWEGFVAGLLRSFCFGCRTTGSSWLLRFLELSSS